MQENRAMEKKYTSEEHDRCKRVAEAFQELYDLYGDMCMVDAGEFGFVHLLWFWKGNFDSIWIISRSNT